MLEFLNEDHANDADLSSEVDLSTNGDDHNEYIKVEPASKKVRKTNYMLGGLFCIGLIGLLVMVKTSGPQSVDAQESASSAEQAQIEVTIARLTGAKTEIFDGISKVVDKFDQFSAVKQVSADRLLKNPFAMDYSTGSGVIDRLDGDSGEDDQLMAEQIKNSAGKLQLLTIMQSGRANTESCCMINDKLLYEGDEIEGFRVCQIGKNFVKLKSNGVEVTLKLLFD